MKQPISETRYLKITVTGTKKARANQFKLLTEFADVETKDLTIDDIAGLLKKLKIWADVTRGGEMNIFDLDDIAVCYNCGCVVFKGGAKTNEDSYICPCCKENIPM